jgi:ATP-dependent RNA helicase DeaD
METIPLLLEGRDVLGQAQTGTGKTAAFALPMLHALDPACAQVQGLVVSPTRELANQVARAVYGYGQHRDVRVLPIYGGQSYTRQMTRLKRGVDVVVGTPGRMLDLIEKGALDLSAVRFLVLDEADEMLSMGFIEDIQAIMGETPKTRQTALFSATLPDGIRRLADGYMRTPAAVTIDAEHLTVENIEQRYYVVRVSDKVAALTRLLEIEDTTGMLIFCRTKVGTAELADTLYARGFKAEALHGDLNQQARESVLGRFRRRQIDLLVATDVAARGLDIEDISHVINYDLPTDPQYYVHRIGRTGRAGKAGVAISLVTPKEGWRVRKLAQYTRRPIARAELPTVIQVLERRDERFLVQLTGQLAQGQAQRERALLARLAETGADPLDLAAAAMQLARAEEQQRPIAHIAEIRVSDCPRNRVREQGRRAPRRRDTGRRGGREPGMVRLSMNAGKKHSIRPGEVVGAIAGTAGIPGKAIGAITIHQRQTFVDVAVQHEAKVLRRMRGWQLRGQAIVLERAS